MTWADYLGVGLLGLLGGGHCVGMCGVFAMAASRGSTNGMEIVARQLAYQLGKATSYFFIGAVLLTLTGWLDGLAPVLMLQVWLGRAVGAAMVLAGLAYALEWRLPARWTSSRAGHTVCTALSALWLSPSLGRCVLLGWVNGFLPCGLSLTALLYLVNYGTLEAVALGSYIFGLATTPALLALAFAGARLSLRARRLWLRGAGVLLVGLGMLTMLRGEPQVHDWFHRYLAPSPWGAGGAEHGH